MAETTASLGVLVFGRDKSASKTLNSLKKAAKRVQGALGTALKAGALASAVALAAATKAAIDFEKSLSEIQTLRFPHADVQEMRTLVQGLAVQFGDLDAQSAAAYQAISAGAQDLGSVLVEANKLAVGGVTDTATAIDGLTNVMNAWKESGLTAQQAANSFFVAIKLGKTNAEELSKFIGNAASTLAAFGVTFNEAMAAIAAGSATMGNARKVITGLRQAVLNIKAPTKDAREEADRLGIKFNSAALRAKGFKGLLDDITSSANFNKDSLGKLFNSAEGLGAVLALTANEGKAFSNALRAMENDTTAAQEAFETMSKSTSFQIQRLGGMFSVLATEVGKLVKGSGAFKGVLEGVSTVVATAIVFFTRLSASTSITEKTWRDFAIRGGALLARTMATVVDIGTGVVEAFFQVTNGARQVGIWALRAARSYTQLIEKLLRWREIVTGEISPGLKEQQENLAKLNELIAEQQTAWNNNAEDIDRMREIGRAAASTLDALGDAIAASAKQPRAALAELRRQTEETIRKIRERINEALKPPAAPPEDPTGLEAALEKTKRFVGEIVEIPEIPAIKPIVIDEAAVGAIRRARDATLEWQAAARQVGQAITGAIGGAISSALFDSKNLGQSLVDAAKQVGRLIVQLLIAKGIATVFGGVGGFLIGQSGGFAGRLPRSPKKFQGGGFAGRDEVPALLNREELVLSAGVVKAIKNNRNPRQTDALEAPIGGQGDVNITLVNQGAVLPLASEQERQLDEGVLPWTMRRRRLGLM